MHVKSMERSGSLAHCLAGWRLPGLATRHVTVTYPCQWQMAAEGRIRNQAKNQTVRLKKKTACKFPTKVWKYKFAEFGNACQ